MSRVYLSSVVPLQLPKRDGKRSNVYTLVDAVSQTGVVRAISNNHIRHTTHSLPIATSQKKQLGETAPLEMHIWGCKVCLELVENGVCSISAQPHKPKQIQDPHLVKLIFSAPYPRIGGPWVAPPLCLFHCKGKICQLIAHRAGFLVTGKRRQCWMPSEIRSGIGSGIGSA